MATLACHGQHSSTTPYAVSVRVEADAGLPLEGVVISRDGSQLARTGAKGEAQLQLLGEEGAVIALEVRCPKDHAPATAEVQVPLRRLQDGAKPSYRVACRPTLRNAVIVVRAVNGAGLPVIYLGKEVARTNDDGVTHLQLKLMPGERFELTLNTEGAGVARLIPQHATEVFVMPDRDEVMLFSPRFELKKPRRVGPRRVIPRPL
jgi:hypothetical protein